MKKGGDVIIGFIKSLPVWYGYLCLYFLISIFGFCYFYTKVTKEIEKYIKENNSDKEVEIDYVALYITSLFSPIIFAFNFANKVIEFIMQILIEIISFIVGVFSLFKKDKKQEGENCNETNDKG